MIDLERYGPYRTWDQVWDEVDRVAREHPGLVEVFEYGRSVHRIPLRAVRVARPGAPATVPAVVVSAVHAMEWIGVEALLAVLSRAATEMAAGSLDGRAITFVPIVNPDGYLHVQADLEGSRWRFTRRNARRVDLNRNFATHFDPRRRWLDPVHAQGAHPWSEPETQALRDLAETVRPQRFCSMHAFGGYFLYPYTGSRRPPPDEPLYRRIGAEMRALQPRYPYRLVRVGALPRWMWARGSEVDWFRDRFGALSFLFEVSKGGLELRAPWRALEPFCWYNPRDVAAEVLNVLPAAMHLLSVPLGGERRQAPT